MCTKNCCSFIVLLVAVGAGFLFMDGHHGVMDLIKSNISDRTRIGKYDNAHKTDGELSHNDQEYTNMYYDLATDFYEYGWGQSFHFATMFEGESFHEHIRRHEYYLASKLDIKETDIDRTKVFGEAFRLLKEGGMFASYEWLMTDNYDPTNEEHKIIKRGIEHGDGLPELIGIKAAVQALKDVGFEVVEHFDLNHYAKEAYGPKNIPWYRTLEADWTLDGWKHTVVGRKFTEIMVRVLESIGIAAEGSFATLQMLEDAATHLVKGGQQDLFTPMYLVVARKPAKN
eukprot:jgi/Bigna1/66661/fgenesh1_pg.2_\